MSLALIKQIALFFLKKYVILIQKIMKHRVKIEMIKYILGTACSIITLFLTVDCYAKENLSQAQTNEDKAIYPESPDFYTKYFKIDLNVPIPDVKALKEELRRQHEVYNPRYIVSWDMGSTFDKLWVATIKNFGTSEKRIKGENEDELIALIKALPKEYYPYIGPYLHTLPSMPDKVLNMPGIKETKNTFPKRIAPQLQGIEDLEFLSPYLYILLMPEMWPSNNKNIEMPSMRPAQIPPIKYEPNFYADVLQNTPKQGFGGLARTDNKPGADKLRTLHATESSPLTSVDIKAFLNTLDDIKEFATLENTLKIIEAGNVLDYWEHKNGTALRLNGLKDAVNPCQRLVLKIKWAGMETEFATVVAQDGFTPEEWAYTCDKTLKAYRVSRISAPQLTSLKIYKAGVYNNSIEKMHPLWQESQFATMQSLLEMYKAPYSDVQAALKNESLIKEKLKPLGGILITTPIPN